MRAVLGNRSPITVTRDPKTGEKSWTPAMTLRRGEDVEAEFIAPEGTSIGEMFTALTASDGGWSGQSDEPPAWVASDSPGLAALLGEHFGCPVVKYKQPTKEKRS